MSLNTFISKLPKAELHVHLLGTIEPELFLTIAKRNGVTEYSSEQDIQKSLYSFNTFEEFLHCYDRMLPALKTEEDFYDITFAYLQRASQEGVLRAEFLFEVQNLENFGISFRTIITGIFTAVAEAKKKFNISAAPILCFLRDLDELSALHTLKLANRYREFIIGCGLAGRERSNPPEKFTHLFAQARALGYKTCVHAGEFMGPNYIRQALFDLQVDRIDHGVRAVEDSELIAYLAATRMPITVCPISNKRLNVYAAGDHPLKTLLAYGVQASIHSDDPAFFGGYITANYMYAHQQLKLSREQLVQSARNSFTGSFADEEEKERLLYTLDQFFMKNF